MNTEQRRKLFDVVVWIGSLVLAGGLLATDAMAGKSRPVAGRAAPFAAVRLLEEARAARRRESGECGRGLTRGSLVGADEFARAGGGCARDQRQRKRRRETGHIGVRVHGSPLLR